MTEVLTGTLDERDHKTHVPVAFTVPQGTQRLVVRFSAMPQRGPGQLFDNLISLSLFGPDGPRGGRHNNPVSDFAIDAASATPGYVAGPIEPGSWTLWLDCFRLLGPEPVTWRVEVACEQEAAHPVPAVQPRVVASKGPGWYRGDLHAHTLHSDGRWDLADLLAFARHRQLDFVTLTDHNTLSGTPAFRGMADDGVLTMGGVELTTHFGHALALGGRSWREWRANSMSGVTMPSIAREVQEAGEVFVIAHPRSPGDPSCTGCRWEYEDMMPGPARAVEIWNGPWSEYNEEGLALFHAWLDEGHRLVATAGTDIHGPNERDAAQGFNHVQASELSEGDILAAVAAGRNYLSSGPRLVATAAVPGQANPVVMGASVLTQTSEAILDIGPGAAGDLRLVADSREILREPVANGVRQHVLPPGTRWFMAELRDAAGDLVAVTNPIYLDGR